MSCPECFKGGVHNHAGSPTGQELDVHGLKCYVAEAPQTSQSKSTIIFLPDAFGLRFINNQLLADRYAKETGFRVLIPDVIPGGDCDQSVLLLSDKFTDEVKWYDVLGQLRRAITGIRIAWIFVPFLIRGNPHKTYPKMVDFARNVKAENPGSKLGVAGFCWGGLPSTLICKEPLADGSSEKLVDAHFGAHLSRVDAPQMIVDAVGKYKVPYSLAMGVEDFVLPHKQVLATEAELRQKFGPGRGEGGYHYEIVNYEGCGHGFAVRGKPGDEVAEKGAEQAAKQAVEWFKKWL